MWRIRLQFPAIIEDCPEHGVPAIDYRKSHDLPEEPTSRIDIDLDVDCEELCREFASLTDDHADIEILKSGPCAPEDMPVIPAEAWCIKCDPHLDPVEVGRTLREEEMNSTRILLAAITPFLSQADSKEKPLREMTLTELEAESQRLDAIDRSQLDHDQRRRHDNHVHNVGIYRLARQGELGDSLAAYTDPTHPEYDPEFDRQIRALRPDWFSHENN